MKKKTASDLANKSLARKRKLLNGCRVPELAQPVTWEFTSKCPDKWLHIDCENGYIYVYNPTRRITEHFKVASKKLLGAALMAVVDEIERRFPKTYDEISKLY